MKIFKQTLRNRILHRRRQLSPEELDQHSEQIAAHLFKQRYYQQAQHISLYVAFQNEVHTKTILENALSLNKSCYFPVMKKNKQLDFFKVDATTQFAPNKVGILEPEPTQKNNHLFKPHHLDLVLVPLVAFDSDCHRLGMGGGYYDATFHFRKQFEKPIMIGLAYDFQKLSYVPNNNLDVLLDGIVTEKHLYGKWPLKPRS